MESICKVARLQSVKLQKGLDFILQCFKVKFEYFLNAAFLRTPLSNCPEMSCKKMHSEKCRTIYAKLHVLESFFNKAAGWRPEKSLKRDSIQLFFCEFCENIKKTLFTEHLRQVTVPVFRNWIFYSTCFLPQKSEKLL